MTKTQKQSQATLWPRNTCTGDDASLCVYDHV